MIMSRRRCLKIMSMGLPYMLSAGLPAAAAAAHAPRPAPGSADWAAWKAAFLAPEGRVVDHLQESASHSEGQGYGMTLAVWFGDHESFERMYAWTEDFLAVRQDPLLAWRWRPARRPQITDYNNATDGDLFYAWALLRASWRFNEPAYLERARDIARFIAVSCIAPDPRGDRLVLLPAAERFVHGRSVTINPAYYMPLAMRELGEATDTPELVQCADDGKALLAEIATAGLIPDWIRIDPEGWQPSPAHPRQSGYEAMRVPLFLIWSGEKTHPAVQEAHNMYFNLEAHTAGTATIIDLEGKTAREASDHPGYAAIAALVNRAATFPVDQNMPRFTAEQPYYPATLHLFALLAQSKPH